MEEGAGDSEPKHHFFTKPEDFVRALRYPSCKLYSELKRQLGEHVSSWTREFLRLDGLGLVFDSLNTLCERGFSKFTDAYLQFECVGVIRAVMDSRIGLDYIVENKEYTYKLGAGKLYWRNYSKSHFKMCLGQGFVLVLD